MIYLAAPYTHEDPRIVRMRVREVSKAAGHLLNQGLMVYSPLSHGQMIVDHSEGILTTREYWFQHNMWMLARCTEMYVLALDGWRESIGVKQEWDRAVELSKQVTVMQPVPDA